MKNNKYNLTSEEILRMLCGADMMTTVSIPEKGVESLKLSDGPIGLRYQKRDKDPLGIHKSERATALPGGPALAACWNPEMAETAGKIIGSEAEHYGVDIILGPAVNMVRNPLCGRNMEYYSEDPYLAGKTAAGYIRGVKKAGADCCIKHFAVNNQETEREYLNCRVDEDALRELYLKAFEIAIKESHPAAVMTSLSKTNGTYAAQNAWLLTKVLRGEWGFDGIVMTDWLGLDDRAASYQAGLDLEMPGMDGANVDIESKAVLEGKLSMDCAAEHATRIADLAKKLHATKRNANLEDTSLFEKNHAAAIKIAEESCVLLRNEKETLPLKSGLHLAVIGEYAEHPLFQAKGSGKVTSALEENPLGNIRVENKDGVTDYAPGYRIGDGETAQERESLIQESTQIAEKADAVIFFVATDNTLENEGLDRKEYALPSYQTEVLNKVATANSHIIVIVANGGAVPMPWAEKTDAILECFYGGQGIGKAVAEILFGIVNPSGHLPISVPRNLQSIISWENFAHASEETEYREGLFMGYRGYVTKGIPVQWPFGFGLSYTTFELDEMKADRTRMSDQESVQVSMRIRNTGNTVGAQVVQIYIQNAPCFKARPKRELREFQKVFLAPGEEKKLVFSFGKDAFKTWDERIGAYSVPGGTYLVQVGFSCEEIRAEIPLEIVPVHPVPDRIVGWSSTSRLLETEKGSEYFDMLATLAEKHAAGMFVPKAGDLRSSMLQLPIRISHLMLWSQITQADMIHILEECNLALYEKYRKEETESLE